jgi:hypothetical protein
MSTAEQAVARGEVLDALGLPPIAELLGKRSGRHWVVAIRRRVGKTTVILRSDGSAPTLGAALEQLAAALKEESNVDQPTTNQATEVPWP